MAERDLSAIINELGEDREFYRMSVAPPLFQSSNFCFNTVDELRGCLASELDHPFYTRGHNPTVAILRQKLAALEGAEDALIFGSGSAAVAAAVLNEVQQGDHIVCVDKPYGWTNTLITQFLARFGVTATLIDGRDPENWRSAIMPNTRVFMMESPNSMTFEMQDIRAVASIAKEHAITTIIDNSYCTPLLQQPIEMGVDVVVHSASKYLGGHSDIVAGVLCTDRKRIERIFAGEYMTLGGIISPNDAWLMLRGLRTLPIRMERAGETAGKVVEFLKKHPKVERMHYPFDPEHPQYELAKRQMKAGAGQFSIELKAENIEAVERFVNHLRRFLIACSWGGYESLVYPVCVLYDSRNYSKTALPWNLVRFYTGLEDADLLIADLEAALAQL